MKCKVFLERKGYKYKGRSQEDGRYIFEDKYGVIIKCVEAKFVSMDGQVMYGERNHSGDLHPRMVKSQVSN